MVGLPPLSLNLARNISWQYDEATALKGLVAAKQAFYTQNYSNFWLNWFSSVFDLTSPTINTFGLIVWSIILDIPIGFISVPSPTSPPRFGFGNGRKNFGWGNFTGVPAIPLLTTDECQRLLRMRFYAQTISPTIYNVNYALKDVFGDLGIAFLLPTDSTGNIPTVIGFDPDGENFYNGNFDTSPAISGDAASVMAQEYIFTFPLSDNFKAALIDMDVLPRGSGVVSTIISP